MEPIAWCLAAATAAILATASGPEAQREPPRSEFGIVEARAKAATKSDPTTVRALIDSMFDHSVLAGMPLSVRDRITRAELAFRKGSRGPVREQDMVGAVNSFAARLGAPPYARTSLDQLRGFRQVVRAAAPHLGSDEGQPRQIASEMSPAEAVFVMSMLARQKLWNPEYQVSPEQWFREYRERGERLRAGANVAETRRGIPAKASADVAAVLKHLEHGLPDEGSAATLAVQQFLDAIGVDR